MNVSDIWVLETLNGKNISIDSLRTLPQIELNIAEMRISGSNGCNNITGSISKMDNEILEFGMLSQTQMACLNKKFLKTLTETKSYKKVKTQLILLNKSTEETIIFKKVD